MPQGKQRSFQAVPEAEKVSRYIVAAPCLSPDGRTPVTYQPGHGLIATTTVRLFDPAKKGMNWAGIFIT